MSKYKYIILLNYPQTIHLNKWKNIFMLKDHQNSQ